MRKKLEISFSIEDARAYSKRLIRKWASKKAFSPLGNLDREDTPKK